MIKGGYQLNTNLILVEGLPGSGKSTFAKKIAKFYKNHKVKVNLYNEGDFHPADLAWNSLIPLELLETILSKYDTLKAEINKNMIIEDNYAVIPYTQIKTENESFYKDMESYEVYNNRLSLSEFTKLHYKRWSKFNNQAKKNELNIFECAFLQNHISELMYFHLSDIESIKTYFSNLIQTVNDLCPMLIYLSHSNIEKMISNVAKERVSPYGNWIDEVINYIETTPYGKLKERKGFDGVIQSFYERKQAELEVIKHLKINTLILENSENDFEMMWKELESKLLILL